MRREVRDRLRAPLAGYLAVAEPAGGWGTYFQTPSISPLQPVEFLEDGRRFETGGTSNYPGAIGLAASVGLLNEIGPAAIETWIRALTDRLIEALRRLPVHLVTPADPRCRSGIVTFTTGGAASDVRLMEYLLDRQILFSVRYTSHVGGLRVSCHAYNHTDDTDCLVEALKDFAPPAST